MKTVWIVSGGLDDGDVILGVYDSAIAANKLVADAERSMTYDNHYLLEGIKYNSVVVREYGVTHESSSI